MTPGWLRAIKPASSFRRQWTVSSPELSDRVSPHAPTVDEHIRAALFVGDEFKGVVSTRYQYQTWGGTRTPERRITGQLSALRDFASAGDFLVIERGLSDPAFYRMRLLRSGTPEHSALGKKVGQRRWGPVDPNDLPVVEEAVSDALNELWMHENSPLALFDNDAILKSLGPPELLYRGHFKHDSSLLRFQVRAVWRRISGSRRFFRD